MDGLVGKRDDLVVLSLDKDFNDTAISSLVSYYNITIAPTLIVNFEHKFEGYTYEYLIRENLEERARSIEVLEPTENV